VAQKWVPKPSMETDGTPLWPDLRVWAYRGEIYHLSGRASRRPDRLDLTPAGGWLPTYASPQALLNCNRRPLKHAVSGETIGTHISTEVQSSATTGTSMSVR